MATECTLQALAALDQTDPDAVQGMLQTCTGFLMQPSLWLWALGITIACAAVGAAIGLAKGRWVAGFVWGAALGPIGWIVIALSRSTLVECPECSRRNVPAAKVCRHCGINLQAAVRRSARATMKRNDSGRGW